MKGRKTFLSFVLSLALLVGTVTPAQAYMTIPGWGGTGDPWTLSYFEKFSVLSDDGKVESPGYDSYYNQNYYNNGYYYDREYYDILVPLMPAYKMDWTSTNYWNMGAVKQQFALYDGFSAYEVFVGDQKITSGMALAYPEPTCAAIFQLTNGGLNYYEVKAKLYKPEVAYDENLVNKIALYYGAYNKSDMVQLSRWIEDPNNTNYRGAPWPMKVSPSVDFEILIAPKDAPGYAVGNPGDYEYKLNVYNKDNVIVAGSTMDADATFAAIYFDAENNDSRGVEPGEYTIKLLYKDKTSGLIDPAKTKELAKFKVDGYSDFINYSIDGNEGIIDHKNGTVNVILPSTSAIGTFTPKFDVEDGATVYMLDRELGDYILQESEVSEVDFSDHYAYYKIESPKGIRYVNVMLAKETLYQLTGSVSLYDGEELFPAKNKAFKIHGYFGDKSTTVTTDAFGNFAANILSSDRYAGGGFFIYSTQKFGGGVNYKLAEASGGNLALGCYYIYPGVDVKLVFSEAEFEYEGFYQFRGKVVDAVTNTPLDGVTFKYNGRDWGSPSAGGDFRFDTNDSWVYGSYGITAHKEGYIDASFSAHSSPIAMQTNGYIDLGIIKMMPLANTNPVTGMVTAVPNYTQRGKHVEVTVKYINKALTQNVAELTVTIPVGVHFVPNSFVNSLTGYTPVISGQTLTLSGNVPQNLEQKLKFWVEVDDGLQNSYFNVDAKIASGSNTYQIGSAYVAVSDITLEVPSEVGVNGGNSAEFTVKGEASAIEGYKIKLDFIRLEDGATLPAIQFSAPLTTHWYSKDINIPGAGSKQGAYLIISSLMDDKGIVKATDSKVVNVVSNALKLTDIYLKSNYIESVAKKPVTNSSYVPGSISVNGSFDTLYDIDITTDWVDTSRVASAAFIASTQIDTKSVAASVSSGKISGKFPAASFKGYGMGKIYLAITKTDGTVENFLVVVLSLLVDPSGYVFNRVTGDRIENAVTTLEEFVGNKWVEWDGTDSGQSNPQKSDKDGKYGWDVMPGTYRVMVTAAGFHAYNTLENEYKEIKVLPPREDINIGMLPLSATLVDSVSVSGAGGSSGISTNGGTLQLTAAVSPADAYDKTVRWSIVSGSAATVSTSSGLVTAVSNGQVKVRATANDGSGKYGEIVITVTGQSGGSSGILAESVSITGGSIISVRGGTLQLTAVVSPGNASDKTVRWSIVSGSAATVSTSSGLVTAVSNGQVKVRATANDGSGKYGEIVITVSNQNLPGGGGIISGDRGGGSSGGGGSTVTPSPTSAAVSTLPAVVPPDALRNPFTDVNEGDWFYGDVNYVYTNGLFTGTSSTTFSPNVSMTRGMLVTVLGRLHGVNTAEFTGSSFSDVSASEYYAPYIEWAKTNGIVLGVGENRFAPDAIITRQDLAVIVIRYVEYAKLVFPVTLMYFTFADGADISEYADHAVQTLMNGKIMNGKPGNIFDPKGNATRAEVAAVLHRFADVLARIGASGAE